MWVHIARVGPRTILSPLANDGLPGLSIKSWVSNGTDELAAFAILLKRESIDLRLFPTNAETSSTTGTRRAFRMIPTSSSTDTGVFSLACSSWGDIDSPVYGSQGADEFDFSIDMYGAAKSVTLPAFRQTLTKPG